jgi:diguanylate cyclase (GGDEF)-like protein
MMFKPDNFKEINDTFGHEAGDQVIVLMSAELKRSFNGDEITVKYMGNELAVVLHGRNRDEAHAEAVRIRAIMNNLDVTACTNNQPFRITVSIGISLFPEHSKDSTELIALAHELPLVGRGRGGNLILFPEDK